MRNVDSAFKQAMEQPGTYDLKVRVEISETRIYFDSDDLVDNAPAWALGPGLQDNPVPQDIIFDGDSLLTVYVNDGTLSYLWGESTTERSFGISVPNHSRPSISDSKLFYVDDTGNLKRADWTNNGDGTVSLSSAETIASVSTESSCHAISDTEIVLFSLDEGGIRATYYVLNGSWESKPMEYRFMSPTDVFTDPYLTNFTAAAKHNGSVFAYCSMPDGSVKGSEYDLGLGKWSHLFRSVDADLSVFRTANAIVSNGAVHLCGQFTRTEELETGSIFNMVLRSYDGRTFAIEPTSLVSMSGYRFMIYIAEQVCFADTNRFISKEPSYQYDSSPALSVPYDDVIRTNISSDESGGSELTMSLRCGGEEYNDEDVIAHGNVLLLYIAYSDQEVFYNTYIIDGVKTSYADGEREMSIYAVGAGTWQTERIPSPLYTELVGLSFTHDDLDERDNMYVAPNAGMGNKTLSVDFWECEGFSPDETVTAIDILDEDDSPQPYEAVASHKVGVKTEDISSKLFSEYPVARGDVTVYVYGWSRTKASGHENDHVTPYLVIEDNDGEEQTIAGTVEGSNQWPLKYVDAVDRSYPIIADFALANGDKIKRVGLVFEASNDTIFLPARVDIEGVGFAWDSSGSNLPWDIVEDGFQTPSAAQPYIMFSVRPFSTDSFCVRGTFHRERGRVPNPWDTYCGLVSFAEDGANYVMARYCWQKNEIEIVKVRNNIKTVLASTNLTASVGDQISLQLKHHGGRFSVFVKVDDIWSTPILEYEWQKNDGALSTSDTGIMHVGIYGEVQTPHFMVLRVDTDKSNCIGMAPEFSHYALDEFPKSGKVQIGDNVYEYNGKTNSDPISPILPAGTALGPYPAIGVDDSEHLIGIGVDTKYFNYNPSWPERNDALCGENFILVLDALSYILGDGPSAAHWLEDRSRFFSSSLTEYTLVDNKTKFYLTHGLVNVELVDGEPTTHFTGEVCHVYTTEKVRVSEFSGSGLSNVITLKDMLRKLSAMVGVETSFSGDIESSVQASESGTQV